MQERGRTRAPAVSCTSNLPSMLLHPHFDVCSGVSSLLLRSKSSLINLPLRQEPSKPVMLWLMTSPSWHSGITKLMDKSRYAPWHPDFSLSCHLTSCVARMSCLMVPAQRIFHDCSSVSDNSFSGPWHAVNGLPINSLGCQMLPSTPMIQTV